MNRVRDGYAGSTETLALLVVFMAGKVFLGFPRHAAEDGATAAWMLPLIAGVMVLPVPWIYASMLRGYPGLSLIEMAQLSLGRLLGTGMGLVFAAFFLFLSTNLLRQFSESMLTLILPETPLSVIAALFLSGMALGAYYGIETISRCCWLLAPFFLGAVTVILLGTIPWAEGIWMFPLWGAGPSALIRHAARLTSSYAELLVLAIIIPSLREAGKMAAIGTQAVLLSAALMALVTLMFILVFPVPSATELTEPLYHMSRIIYYGRFIQRIDGLFIPLWVIAGLLMMCTALYGAAVSLARSLQIPDYRPLVFPLALLAFTGSFYFGSLPEAEKMGDRLLHLYAWIIAYALPFVIGGVLLWRGRGNRGWAKEGPDEA